MTASKGELSSESVTSAPGHLTLAATAIIGVSARLLTASAGDNYDMQSWWLVSEASRHEQAVYAFTHRYNYGPIWWWIISAFRTFASWIGSDTITTLHILLSTLLSLVDLGLAAVLYRGGSPRAAALFFLNPISIAVTGYHIQFDNFAILIALLAWALFLDSRSKGTLLIASTLFGFSLALKHVFILFLGWLPFLTSLRTLRDRALFGCLALVVFLLSFAPWVNEAAVWVGIQKNVFGYVSTEGHSVISHIAHLIPGIPPRTLFMILTLLVGVILVRKERLHRCAPYLYLIVLVALSSGMARNYLAVPMVALFSLSWSWFSSLYLTTATLALVTVNPSLGVTEVVVPLFSSGVVTYELAQVALLGIVWRAWRRNGPSIAQARRSESPQTP